MKATNVESQREGADVEGGGRHLIPDSRQVGGSKDGTYKRNGENLEMELQSGSGDIDSIGFYHNRKRSRKRRGRRRAVRASRSTCSDEDDVLFRTRVISHTAMAPPNTNRFLAEDYEKRSELSILEWEQARERESNEGVFGNDHGEGYTSSAGESFDEIYDTHAVTYLEGLSRQELILKCLQLERYGSDMCNHVHSLRLENERMKLLLSDNSIRYPGLNAGESPISVSYVGTTNSEADNENEEEEEKEDKEKEEGEKKDFLSPKRLRNSTHTDTDIP